MAERKISPTSLKNLSKANQESNRLTREAIEISLLQLLEKKDLAKITISELVTRAGVSRAAFYRNYSSKEAILETIFRQAIQRMMEKLPQKSVRLDLYGVWLAFFKEAKKEAYIISLAIDYNMEKLLQQAMFEFLERGQKKTKKDGVSYLHSFWSSAVISILSKWVKEGMKVPAEKLASLGLPFLPREKKEE